MWRIRDFSRTLHNFSVNPLTRAGTYALLFRYPLRTQGGVLSLQFSNKNIAEHLIRALRSGMAFAALLPAVNAHADIRITPPEQAVIQSKQAASTESPPSSAPQKVWHFQATYGVSSADVESPYWDTRADPVAAAQKSTTGVFSESRFSHSSELPMNSKQSMRFGLSLVNAQSGVSSGWLANLAGQSNAPDWRAWGLGADVFLLRHTSASLDLDAGFQADYYISGVATLPTAENASAETQKASRLAQKSGWRIAFTGGIGGLYIGPLGLILRLSGQVLQAQFDGHALPLRAQGLQIQVGAGLALGRGEP